MLLHVVCVWVLAVTPAQAQPLPPELTQPVNDFAHVIDSASARELDSLIRSLQQTTGDVVVVATVDTFAPYGTIDEYAVKMFENRGRGIGERGRDNGLLILVAIRERRIKFEVGYELEQFITDGFSGQTTREDMAPSFRRGEYGEGILAGTQRVISRIAQGRNVTLQGVRPERRRGTPQPGSGGSWIVALIVLFMIINVIAGRLRGRRRFRGGWVAVAAGRAVSARSAAGSAVGWAAAVGLAEALAASVDSVAAAAVAAVVAGPGR